MLIRILAFTVLIALGTTGYATAACTAEEAQAKAQTFQEAAMAAVQKDPKKYQDAMTALQKEIPALQQANNLDAICAFYDNWTQKLQ